MTDRDIYKTEYENAEQEFIKCNKKADLRYYSVWLLVGTYIIIFFIYVVTRLCENSVSEDSRYIFCRIVKSGMQWIVSHWKFICGFISAGWILYKFQTERQSKVLSEYNNRFYTTRCIRETTKEIGNRLTMKEKDGSITFSPPNESEEAFYRFFEEIELNIQRGILNSRDVYDLFAYYALAGINEGVLRPTDYEFGNWELLRKFINRMKPLYDFHKKYENYN
ncbi:MAG: hypothetical protein K2K82_01070 [Muribaculaceae bacterium]|nr:hypothetical protein [Muribaculaceae bacterium]